VSLDYGGGGFYRFMRLINYVFTEGCGAVWVIDFTDRDRLVESREEFQRMRDDVLQTDLPILVLANKQDLPVRYIITSPRFLSFER
jgi:signal recognition particle receptor subunit beta